MAEIDNWDDVYVEAENGHDQPETEPTSEIPVAESSDLPPREHQTTTTTSSDSTAPPSTGIAPPEPHQHPQTASSQPTEQDDGIPIEALSTGDELVAEKSENVVEDAGEAAVLAETTEITHEAPVAVAVADDHLVLDAPQNTLKPTDDPEFLQAAAAQRNSKSAEWQFDSSDAESSDDSSESDSSSDSDDDEGSDEEDYEMLDPAALAKILMTGDGEDDDGAKGKGGKSAADVQPRTANEVKEMEIIKPDIEITPTTKITFLGNVERVVENMALIKGATPGEYQVLESGSVLCNEAREVLGVVADTFGRVQEPLYSVAFTNAQAIKDAGLEHGSKVFYVDQHSTFVFTQPLRNLKGTDASNIHDEEVADHEAEFSDDEAEAEAKRARKQAKQAARGGGPTRGRGRGAGARSFGAPGHDSGTYSVGGGSDAPTQNYGGGMSYDDDETEPAATAEFYSPLKRPENLSELMAGGGGGAAPPPRPSRGAGGRGAGDRGRGSGRGGRGDRGGRGRGGGGVRGGRGGNDTNNHHTRGDNNNNNFRGNAHSFPDRHNATPTTAPYPPQVAQQHSLPTKPFAPQGALMETPQLPQQTSSYSFGGYQFQFNPQQQPQQQQQQQQVPGGGYVQQHQQPQQQVPGGYPPQQMQQIPGGAYVNPAFFGQGQQQWGQQYPNPGQQQQYPNGGQQQQYPNGGQQQRQQGSATPAVNLADILKTLGGGAVQQQQQQPPTG